MSIRLSKAEIEYPKSKIIKKIATRKTKVQKPTVCEQHQMVDYKTLVFLTKEQMKIIKLLTKAVSEMEEKREEVNK